MIKNESIIDLDHPIVKKTRKWKRHRIIKIKRNKNRWYYL